MIVEMWLRLEFNLFTHDVPLHKLPIRFHHLAYVRIFLIKIKKNSKISQSNRYVTSPYSSNIIPPIRGYFD